MTNENLLTPVGRLVGGSLYTPKTTDMNGNDLVYKSGPDKGKPRVNFWIPLAIEKGKEKHWNETSWGLLIYNFGQRAFPDLYSAPIFAWKISDGDDATPNSLGKIKSKQEGYPGHWILNFSGAFCPQIGNRDFSKLLTEKDFINPGDFIQVRGTLVSNNTPTKPGIHLNPTHVAFAAYGERIVFGPTAEELGFGKAPLPAGAKSVPDAGADVEMPWTYESQILNSKSGERVMLPASKGLPYDHLISIGWTDEMLVKHEMMQIK